MDTAAGDEPTIRFEGVTFQTVQGRGDALGGVPSGAPIIIAKATFVIGKAQATVSQDADKQPLSQIVVHAQADAGAGEPEAVRLAKVSLHDLLLSLVEQTKDWAQPKPA